MIPTLKALERRLVEERTEIAVARLVDRFLLTWQLAIDRGSSPPTSLDFSRALDDERLHLLTIPSAMQYLDECHAHESQPDRKRLLRILLTFGWRGPTAADLLALEDRVRSEVPDQRRRSRRRRRRSRAPREGGRGGPAFDYLGL